MILWLRWDGIDVDCVDGRGCVLLRGLVQPCVQLQFSLGKPVSGDPLKSNVMAARLNLQYIYIYICCIVSTLSKNQSNLLDIQNAKSNHNQAD